jgi:hypothetical protein
MADLGQHNDAGQAMIQRAVIVVICTPFIHSAKATRETRWRWVMACDLCH